MAVQCTKTLLVTSSRGSPVLQYCVGQLIPHLVSYIGRVAEDADDAKASERRLGGVEDVVKTFVAFVSALPDEGQSKCFLSSPVQVGSC